MERKSPVTKARFPKRWPRSPSSTAKSLVTRSLSRRAEVDVLGRERDKLLRVNKYFTLSRPRILEALGGQMDTPKSSVDSKPYIPRGRDRISVTGSLKDGENPFRNDGSERRFNQAPKDDMIRIGDLNTQPKYKVGQVVIWRDEDHKIMAIIEPYHNEPDLKPEFRDWGYRLSNPRKKGATPVICESDLKTREELAKGRI